MERDVEKFLSNMKRANIKRFNLATLENHLINIYGSQARYLDLGGYLKLYNVMTNLKINKKIREIKSSKYNGLNPPLKLRWETITKEESLRWDNSKMLQYSDYLDFSYYKKRPSYQTELEWEYIENIYNFIKTKDKRQWVSLEERSLELFYDEKYLNRNEKNIRSKGNYGILKRLGLSYEDLKMKKYGEMFIYWNKGVRNIKKIIILENHSTFFTYKRFVMNNISIFGFKPDALIYGEGKKVENSLGFLEEIADVNNVEILYFGDIDSEGFGIYSRLKERYGFLDIKLQRQGYKHLIELCNKNYPLGGQDKNKLYLNNFLGEMKDYLNNESLKKLEYIWDNDFRVPQELINYDYLLAVK